MTILSALGGRSRRSNAGGNSGSREPDPCCTGSGPSGFDPGRGFTVIWHKSWQDRPVLVPDKCAHSCTEQLSINQRLEPARASQPDGARKIALDGIVCMDCGVDTTGHFSVAEALRLCMDQHGWNREVGLRLYNLASAHAAELMEAPAIPIWSLYAMGWSGREITKALNDGRLNPASMREEVEALSKKIDPIRRAA